MARKLNAGDVTRGNWYAVYPEEIIVDPKDNGRFKPGEPRPETYASILAEGQLQPVKVEQLEDRRVKLLFGYGRVQEFIRINKNGGAALLSEKALKRVTVGDNGRLKIRCEALDSTDELSRLLTNIAENVDRTPLTPMDEARDIERLKVLGLSGAEIARKFGNSNAWVTQRSKFLKLPAPMQNALHVGKLTATQALQLAELEPGPAQDTKFAKMLAGGDAKGGAGVARTDDAGNRPWSVSKLRTFLEARMESDKVLPGEKRIYSALHRLVDAKLAETTFVALVRQLTAAVK